MFLFTRFGCRAYIVIPEHVLNNLVAREMQTHPDVSCWTITDQNHI